ncbi:MAG: hypothetical protein WB762_33810 [Candidatus Sulfotelmatobacter sp.]
MKAVLVSIFSAALMVGAALAQDSATPNSGSPMSGPQASAQASPVARIAPGSVIPVSLTKTIDAKKAKTGDEVVAKVTQDMKSSNGEVIVAKDTKVMGHVTEAQARNKEQKESQVAIAFDRAVLKNGSEMQMPMSIQAIIGPQNSGPQNNQSDASGGTANTAAPSSGGSPMSQRSGMGGSAPTSAPAPAAAAGGGAPSDAETGTKTRPAITAQTQGVVGIADLTLTPAAAQNRTQGSVVTSEKNNVKLEGGTMLLLRVN